MDNVWTTVIICGVLVLFGALAVRSYVKKLRNGCCGAGGDSVKRIRPEDKEAAHYFYARKIKIEGMSCKNCALRIENAFHEQKGFYAKVHLKEKYAVVRCKHPVSDSQLKETVQRAGYQVAEIGPADEA